ncbi:hypothetical protein F2Q69_00023252 [Brassica cretica]|uniref:Uncharacterized protein n=1 Tax=Brassica cretica TaxID=69181 RepID=A0A8S9QBV1_BRACR|nr:hypothetical protein F2Q69_00023252 [Brassica cretica]
MRGGRGLFIGISNQSETSRVAARVFLRMAPDACAAAPRAPLVFQHAQMQGDTTPSTCLDAWSGSMQGDTTSSTCQTACFGSMHRDISCLAVPPRASMCHSPCCDHFYCNTSCFPCHIPCQAVARASRSIRPISAFPVNFSSRDQSQYFSAPVLMI